MVNNSSFSQHEVFEPIKPFQRFFRKVVRGSYPLFFAAVLALIWANFSATSYHSLWETELSLSIGSFHITKSCIHWIDEALMSLFFFTVGLEIKREILVGELASFKRALLPVAAAVGGMVFPALIYAGFNYGTPAAKGWGIPMATDIAFSLAVLAILGNRIPLSLRIFLSALAIADDLGAVLIIALFYTQKIAVGYLIIAVVFVGALAAANMLWIRWASVYAILGIGMWFAILGSGIHATVAGVIVAMFIPAKGKYDTDTFIMKVKAYLRQFKCEDERYGSSTLLNREHLDAVEGIDVACYDVKPPLQRLEKGLQSWVTLLILPLFALANSGIVFKDIDVFHSLTHPVIWGIALGLFVGKPLGISLFVFLTQKFLKTPLPGGVSWLHMLGVSMLAGIGFTMSLFISGLSFPSADFTELSKMGIILGSLLSGFLGFTVLRMGEALQSTS